MRYLEPYLEADLRRKMVFLGGPRQVGKTTLARAILKAQPSGVYFNWDADEDQKAILEKRWKTDDRLLVFDELHKFRRWKTWIKGVYDTQHDLHSFLLTGSARLDVYKKGGDSLIGRYHYWRLHPFTLDELPDGITPAEALERLLTVGGFPEPFLENDADNARRWRKERLDRLMREDIRDLEPVRQLSDLQILVRLLRERVGSQVVVSHLAADLQVAPQTVKHWLDILEHMYVGFRVKPYATRLTRAIVKPPKFYFFDNADVIGDDGARLENLVATHLLKRLHFLEDKTGRRYELQYLRDREGREVDFVIVEEGAPVELIEVKQTDDAPSRSLRYYSQKFPSARATQIVKNLSRGYSKDGIEVRSVLEYFSGWQW